MPAAYSESSHSTHLPSWLTYLEMSGTVFWPWSSNSTGPMMVFGFLARLSLAATLARSGPTASMASTIRVAATYAKGP